jgi:DNA primase
VDKLASFPVAIPSETIEQVAAGNDIVEVIGSYFPLKRAGANFKALCPFHQEKTPSFIVSPSRQTFHCFGCGAGGSVFRFVMEYEHLDFPAAVRKLAQRAGITIVEKRVAADEDRQYETRRKLLKLHAEAAEWFHENLTKREIGEPARKYLKQRGITSEIAKRWQIGYAPDEWDAFGSWARGQGFDARELVASGLVKTKDDNQITNFNPRSSYDRFRGRIMFPICNSEGEVIAFSGRLLKEQEGAPKYLNSPETPLFQKANVLFGFHKSKRALIEAKSAIVCEGQLDLISLFEAGIMNVVAPQGTAFTESQARILKRFDVNEVILCFDSDAAGMKAAERSLDALLENDFIIRVVELPSGEDPDSLVRREGGEQFGKRLARARDFFDYRIEGEIASADLNSMAAKVQAARNLAMTISRVQNPAVRGEVVNKASARLGIAPGDFESLLAKHARTRGSSVNSSTAEIRAAASPSHDIAMLCLLALRDVNARKFLLTQNWREVLGQVPDSDILIRILESELEPDDTASLNAFMATLSQEDERLISSWLMQKMPAATETVIDTWWQGICRSAVHRRLETVKSQLKLPGLSPGEELNLQKQILDLQEQLHEFWRPVGGGET